ncbi:MAG: hypothetical protein M3032_01130 [Verrucomicrobiota bacterium]|nr:hypothetical protein [Verrucomicrobiota bacterium]
MNVVESDGTKRLVLSSRSSFPGIVFRGKEYPHLSRADAAGLLFFNDEGTESGGLIFAGARDKNGQVSSHGHLSFDRYEQDQVFSLDAGDEDGKQSVSISMQDRPEFSLGDVLALSRDEQEKYYAAHAPAPYRLYLGRSEDGSVALRLKDIAGHNRVLLQVAADGTPTLQFLGEDGGVTYSLPPR